MTRIELVRHAKAQSRDRWWGRPDRKRPLSEAGMDQSRTLARHLCQGRPISALYSSPFVRCTETLQPLAQATGLPIMCEEALAEVTALPMLDHGDGWIASAWLGGRAVALANRIVHKHDGERVVLCTHGDVVPALMALLVGRDELDVESVRLKKGGRFSLDFEGLRCVAATFSPAPTERTRG